MLASLALGFLSIEVGMKLSISTIVINDLYQNSNSYFSISQTEASWYGKSNYFINNTYNSIEYLIIMTYL